MMDQVAPAMALRVSAAVAPISPVNEWTLSRPWNSRRDLVSRAEFARKCAHDIADVNDADFHSLVLRN
jgi:hypothetical protein